MFGAKFAPCFILKMYKSAYPPKNKVIQSNLLINLETSTNILALLQSFKPQVYIMHGCECKFLLRLLKMRRIVASSVE